VSTVTVLDAAGVAVKPGMAAEITTVPVVTGSKATLPGPEKADALCPGGMSTVTTLPVAPPSTTRRATPSGIALTVATSAGAPPRTAWRAKLGPDVIPTSSANGRFGESVVVRAGRAIVCVARGANRSDGVTTVTSRATSA
jgi:hypothetical protein